ncbi:hypothetical protein SH1V18_35930 [Vallitalea longa]|uniref:HTH cro/C1-type domain-containing protein n=1 Tax=Vallitalea longa TaxID=2936439 RepID=A0A9W6DH59_9FIRM|nr:helix-turn-helix transcriptional regulator [Vallitalea longa]GKX31113.1 hypothetical protein SH1V18_35930 [Vallitalea longa]
MSDFGAILKRMRVANSLTQKQVADYLGVSRATVGGYETKGKQPDYETLISLSNYFKVTIDYLLGNDNNFNMIELNNGLTIIEKLEDLMNDIEATDKIVLRGKTIDDVTKNYILETLKYTEKIISYSLYNNNN